MPRSATWTRAACLIPFTGASKSMRIWSGVESAERGSTNGRDTKITPSTRLRIGITSTLAAGGEMPGRKADEYITWAPGIVRGMYVSRKLVAGKGPQRQPDHGTV